MWDKPLYVPRISCHHWELYSIMLFGLFLFEPVIPPNQLPLPAHCSSQYWCGMTLNRHPPLGNTWSLTLCEPYRQRGFCFVNWLTVTNLPLPHPTFSALELWLDSQVQVPSRTCLFQLHKCHQPSFSPFWEGGSTRGLTSTEFYTWSVSVKSKPSWLFN